ncbi:hypothetical protein ACUVAJ_003577 [Vibrio cholerae]
MIILKNEWIKLPLLLYITGFVVHNTYLASYGSYEFELVQAKYILSGFGAVVFSAICFAFVSIKVNLSYVFDSLRIDNLLPWLLRVVSLPYVIYSVLYLDSLPNLLVNNGSIVDSLSLLFFLSHMVVSFTIIDLVFMYSDGNRLSAKIIRSVLRVISIPMVISTIIFSWSNPEFFAVLKASSYFFLGILGLGLRQEDKKYGVEPDYLDSKAKKEHQELFTFFFGAISIAAILWVVVNNYVSAIYPRIPVAFGGAEIEFVEIHMNDSVQKAQLIQETSNWILYINSDTDQTEKLKSSNVTKIVYRK